MKSLEGRASKVGPATLAGSWDATSSLTGFILGLPDVLAVKSMKTLAHAFVKSRKNGSERLLMYGGHVIKCGLGPLLSRWIRDGVFTAVATNGAGSIHDMELAVYGQTSEDVEKGIADGSFGMWRETGDMYACALEGSGCLGEGIGRVIIERGGDPEVSPLAMAVQMGIPGTVHPSLGCDIVHPLPAVSWVKLAAAAERDFNRFGAVLGNLGGGVTVNAGSAVVMPEVFLKALTCARNLGFEVNDITCADFDMIRQYRPSQNVLARPVAALGGVALSLTGHHEIMLPLLDAFIRTAEVEDV